MTPNTKKENDGSNMLSHSNSKGSALHREGSAQRIVPDNYLGPQKLRNQGEYGVGNTGSSPFRGGGRPASNMRSNANSAMKKPSMMNVTTPNETYPTDGNYSDEGF